MLIVSFVQHIYLSYGYSRRSTSLSFVAVQASNISIWTDENSFTETPYMALSGAWRHISVARISTFTNETSQKKQKSSDWDSTLHTNWFPFEIKGTVSRLRQFLAIKRPLKMIKNAFNFISRVFFVLKIFKFLSWLFGHVAKQIN